MPSDDEQPNLTPLAGGHRGETFLAAIGGEKTVVRIYGRSWARRGDAAAEIDAATLRLVSGLVPAPAVIEVRRGNGDSGLPPLLVTSFVEGSRLDDLLPKLDEKELRTVSRNVGVIVARLAQMPMLTMGPFVDGRLRVGSVPPDAHALSDRVEAKILQSPALRAWSSTDLKALRGYALHSQGMLSDVLRRTLVHGDFDPTNVLVDRETLTVTAVVDWELAHAGVPLADLGNLLRVTRTLPEKPRALLQETVLRAYAELVPDAPPGIGAKRTAQLALDHLHERARAADLAKLVELAARGEESPVTKAAHDLLQADVRAYRAQS